MKESNLQRLIQIAVAKLGARLLRNNVALAWVGKSIQIKSTQTIVVNHGDVVIRTARPLHAGLCSGSSDLIGWTPVTVTSAMIGKPIAVFTACEIKIISRVTKEQQLFIDAVKSAGGIAFVARSIDDAIGGIHEFVNHKENN